MENGCRGQANGRVNEQHFIETKKRGASSARNFENQNNRRTSAHVMPKLCARPPARGRTRSIKVVLLRLSYLVVSNLMISPFSNFIL